MARTMVEEMVRQLEAQGVTEERVRRYKANLKNAIQNSSPYPCPMCFGNQAATIGELSLYDSNEGLKNAYCGTCGMLTTTEDFVSP